MSQLPKSDDPKIQAHMEKIARHDRSMEHIFRRILHIMEQIIAAITIIALLGALVVEVMHMFTNPAAYFENAGYILHNLLAIVVGLEFVRMLIDTTPRQHFGGAYCRHHPACDSEPRRPLEQCGLHRLHCRTVRHPPFPDSPQRAERGNGGSGVMRFLNSIVQFY